MKLKRGMSGLWAWAYRWRLVRASMPFWRVVVEAKLMRGASRWPRGAESAVAAVFVWARTIEEAEALAVLALEQEGLAAITADAKKCAPAAAPKLQAMAVARTELGFLTRAADAAQAGRLPRRDART